MTAGQSLPSRFPIFPLRGALLLPGGNLPLNIFEPRYLQMVRDAMQADRVIGMIQPRGDQGEDAQPAIFATGCAGQITNFSETDDGRYLITLTGFTRFDVSEELNVGTPYRQVTANYERWRDDMHPATPPAALKRRLMAVLKGFFDRHGIEAEWAAVEAAPLPALIVSLAMICPFAANEKQALLEAKDQAAQGELLVALMEMDTLASGGLTPGSAH